MRLLFPTVIHELKVDNFGLIKKGLVEFVYEEREKDSKGLEFSNQGGWQSDFEYCRFDNILLSTVTKALNSYFENDVLDMSKKITYNGLWMNINGKDNFNSAHNHPGCHLAGVFWIQSPKGCGNLELQNPHSFTMFQEMMRYTERFQKKSNAYDVYTFPPIEGTILLFPASLMHKVDLNQSDEDRISAAFNLHLSI